MEKQSLAFERVEHNIALNTHTIQYLLKQGKDADRLIALYVFYRYTGAWQAVKWDKPDNRPTATNKYVRQGLGWQKGKLEKYKAMLIDLGLIKNIRKGSDKHYIQVYQVYDLTTPKIVVVRHPENRGPKSIKYKSLKGAGGFLGGEVTKDSYKQIAKEFHTLLAKKNIARVFTDKWTNQFKLLCQKDGYDLDEVKEIANWYPKVIRDKYMPKAYTAQAFRQKFEAIRQRFLETTEQVKKDDMLFHPLVRKILSHLKGFRLPAHAEQELPAAVRDSFANMKIFWKRWKQVQKATKKIYDKEMKKKRRSSDKIHPYERVGLISSHAAIVPLLRNFYFSRISDLLMWGKWNEHLKNVILVEGPELATWISKRAGKRITWKEMSILLRKYSDEVED